MPAVQSLIDKYIVHKHEHHEIPAPWSTSTAVALLVLYTVLYVAPFYMSSLTRPSPSLSRDAPSVIRARVASVTLSCAVCCVLTFLLLTGAPGDPDVPGSRLLSVAGALHLLGVWPVGLQAAARALLLTAALFLGPLFEYLVVQRGWREWAGRRHHPDDHHPLALLVADWAAWRNLVAGPVTEEVLFRAAAVPLLLLARTPVQRTVLLSPIVFGLAHLHHAYEFSITHPRVPMAAVAARALLQFAYTTLFGSYATFLYVRSGSLFAVCVVHGFCNSMGLPRFWGRVHRDLSDQEGDDGPKGSLLWTLAYYCLLLLGAVYWYRHLWPLTESPLALAAF